VVIGWNRSRLDLESDEMLAQILDRGGMAAWRELYALAASDPALRQRIFKLLYRVPLPFLRFWLRALASLGEPIDWTLPLPIDIGS
jgi:hypothetical protein